MHFFFTVLKEFEDLGVMPHAFVVPFKCHMLSLLTQLPFRLVSVSVETIVLE